MRHASLSYSTESNHIPLYGGAYNGDNNGKVQKEYVPKFPSLFSILDSLIDNEKRGDCSWTNRRGIDEIISGNFPCGS
jgi:hypothetical protein